MDTNVSVGASVRFLVYAGSTNTPVTYQWQHEGTNLPGAVGSILNIANVTVTNAGGYVAWVTNAIGGVTNTRTAILTVDPTFFKITSGAIVTDNEASFNSVWWDYDNDGWLDLFVVNTDLSGARRNSLYHSLRDGTFTKVTNAINSALSASISAAASDFDNDGDEDMFVCNIQAQDAFFRNEGGGVFTRLSGTQFGPAVSEGLYSHDAAWVDYDRDGFLDLFVVNGYPVGENDCLYRNNSASYLTKMTAAQVGTIVLDQSQGYACAWADDDGDGYPDVWVNSIDVGGGVYRNNGVSGGVAFSHLTGGGTPPLTNTGAALWGDFDNDGRLDLFVGWVSADGTTNALYRNLGGHSFTNVAGSAGVAEENGCFASAWGDYDNDGWLDLFVANFENGTRTVRNLFYRNRGNGTFEKLDVGSPMRDGDFRAATSWVDYNNDGWLDLFISCGNGTPVPNQLYRNNLSATGNTNHWLKVNLVGKASNRQGLGAKVRVKATIGNTELWQLREITGNSDYSGAPGRLAHFGLGDATNVTTLRIEWPSGIVQELPNVPANQFLTVVESQGYSATNARPAFTGATKDASGSQLSFTEPATGSCYILEASTNLVNWTKLLARTSTGSTTNYTDTRATNYPSRFYRLQVP